MSVLSFRMSAGLLERESDAAGLQEGSFDAALALRVPSFRRDDRHALRVFVDGLFEVDGPAPGRRAHDAAGIDACPARE